LNQSDIIQVGKKDRRHDGRKHYRRHHDYRGGKHYLTPPVAAFLGVVMVDARAANFAGL
jgi:hypothetical protein